MEKGERLIDGFVFVGRVHKHKNDCWADALAKATGKSYDKVYKSLKLWTDENGSLASDIVEGILLTCGYSRYNIDLSETIHDILILFNRYDNHIVIVTDKHVFYVDGNDIFDIDSGVEYDNNYLLTEKVKEMYIKRK